jgi:predicted AAA+ superfamily ATPase
MLKDIVLKQKLEKEQFPLDFYVPRTQGQFARQWLDSSLIKVVLGPRRAGKSIFSFDLLKDRPFMYFNFDDEILEQADGFSTDELMKELHAAYGDIKTIFFDEIQNLSGWELFANRLHRNGYNLVLTGSNAQLLSQELATHLTGRHIPIEILPFDFQEYLRAKKYTLDSEYRSLPQQQGGLLKLMEQYMQHGSFPEVVLSNQDPQKYLDVLIDALLFKDVIKRHRVKFATQISILSTHLINNFSSLYSLRKVQGILNLKSITTTEKYTAYLEEAYVIYSLLGYSAKSGDRVRSPHKAYVVDNGFISAKAVQHSPDTGKLMENLVFMEMVKQGKKPNRDIFYYKTRNNKEVDFIIRKEIITEELIQVAYQLQNPDIEKREVRALLEAAGELNADKLTLITWDEKRQIKKDGLTVNVVPLWEWLLNAGVN